jgi:hypothetical protein
VYSSYKNWKILLPFGLIPPHSTLYLKREIYEKYGNYNQSYKICGDFDYFCRLALSKVNLLNSQDYGVLMRIGGASASSFKAVNKEITTALKNNRIRSLKGMIYIRYLLKAMELRPSYLTIVFGRYKKL